MFKSAIILIYEHIHTLCISLTLSPCEKNLREFGSEKILIDELLRDEEREFLLLLKRAKKREQRKEINSIAHRAHIAVA